MNKFSFFIIIVILSAISCKKQEIPVYQQSAGAYFTTDSVAYSFIENPNEQSVIVNLPISISGDSTNYDRKVNVRIITDSVTNAEVTMYEVKEIVVEAGKFSGNLPIVVNYDRRMDTEEFKVLFTVAPSEDFALVQLNQRNCVLKFSNKIIKPINWDGGLGDKFGTYSTRWWKFIMEKTQKTSLPYHPGLKVTDPERWWMTVREIDIYQSFMRLELAKYNAANPPMMHDDGEKANQLVSMP